MLRAYVVDDERLAVERLTRLLAATRRVHVAGSTTDPQEAVDVLRARPSEIDVLFLDVQMPGLSGFELLEQLSSPPMVVFTTAYDRYAVEAFDVSSVDYLLKPIEPERLERCLDRLERMAHAPAPDVRTLARELASQLQPGRRLERVASRVGERTTILDVAKVTHFVARDKLTYACVQGREHAIDGSLTDLESRLDPRRFVRVHRSAIVNVAFVHELHTAVDGGLVVRLKDEPPTDLPVARDRVRDLKMRLGV